MNEVAKAVCFLAPGTELAKDDIKAAYRIVQVHPDDRPLLAVWWQNKVFVDGALPFGLRSALKIFNTDALERCLKQEKEDDSITIGHAKSGECSLTAVISLCL